METALTPPGTPVTSTSTPVYATRPRRSPSCRAPRPRRHTIHRPDSALGRLPEVADEDAGDQQQAFERISGILSNLLQEANNAVNGMEHECETVPPLQSISKQLASARRLRPPRSIPQHVASSPSPSPLISPCSPPSSPELTAAQPLPQPSVITTPPSMKALSVARRSCPMMRRSSPQKLRPALLLRDPLVESYKRLDLSMALVDSLSRDLASEDETSRTAPDEQRSTTSPAGRPSGRTAASSGGGRRKSNNTEPVDLCLSTLLVLPFLHIPQALISWVFDSLSSRDSSSLTGMVAWCFFFAFANVMVDHAVGQQQQQQPAGAIRRRAVACKAAVPGSYHRRPATDNDHPHPASLLFPRRSARRVVMLPAAARRPSIHRKHAPLSKGWPSLMHDACSTRTATGPLQQLGSLAITRSRTLPPGDAALPATATRRHSF